MEGKTSLQDFVVGKLPTLMYIPDFIAETEETQLLSNIYKAPVSKWKSLKNRRLQNWGGVVHEKGLLPQELPPWLTKITQRIYEESGLFSASINHVLINEYLPDQGIMPHQDGPLYFPVVAILSLMSPVVMDFTPHPGLRSLTDTQSNRDEDDNLNGATSESEAEKYIDNYQPFSVLLMPRSLLIFKDQAYTNYLHGIKECKEQPYDQAVNYDEAATHQTHGSVDALDEDLKIIKRTSTRVALTCRLVLKVHKNLFKI